ncbi:MAG: hypothetical protein Kow00124_01660 [Anaerolineae bacterium]
MAARFAALLAAPAGAEVTLLGVIEAPQDEARLTSALQALHAELSAGAGYPVSTSLRTGLPVEQILAEADEGGHDLVVVGIRGRGRFRRGQVGRTTRRLVHYTRIPLLVVPRERPALRSILICTAAEKPGEADAYVGGRIAQITSASVTILHVMSQIPLTPEARIEYLAANAETLLKSDVREGVHFRRVLGILANLGVDPARCTPKVRHGLVLDEVLSEVREGDYDLVVIGAHQVPAHQSWPRLRRMLQDDIASRILNTTARPVLVVHARDMGMLPAAPPESPA